MKFSPFSIILIFIALMMAGFAVISHLSVNLYPSETLPSFRISFAWPGMPALIVEKEVSSKLEAAMGMLNGVKTLSSVSRHGRGEIQLTFNQGRDPEMTRFEIASAIRQLHPTLPSGVSFPEITARTVSGTKNDLLLYNLTIIEAQHMVRQYLEGVVLPTLAGIDGVDNVSFSGVNPAELNILYDGEKLSMTGVTTDKISKSLNNCLHDVHVGMSYQHGGALESGQGKMPLVLRARKCFRDDLRSVPVKKVSGRIISVDDVSEMSYMKSIPRSYFRINGKSTVLIAVDAAKRANRIALAAKIKEQMEQIRLDLPGTWDLQLVYDDTMHIRNDLRRIALRMFFSTSVLLLLVLMITRNYQYFLLIFLTMVANVFIAVAFYWFFDIEIHLYSLAGITVSFGMIIDNSIVMIEHLRRHRNKSVFLAILAATLTTVGSLLLVFLLDSSRQVLLKDFASVMLINLLVSVLIAWFFVPSLFHFSMRLKRCHSPPTKEFVSLNDLYLRWLHCSQRYRYFFVFLLVMAFGMPVQFLPTRLAGDGAVARIYNASIGSEFYQAKMKHRVEQVLGGSFRLFADKVFRRSYYVDPERTSVFIRAKMPDGANVHQLNEAVVRMEEYLLKYPQLDQFQTRILSHENAFIRVLFKPSYDNGFFPLYLQTKLADKALLIGGVEWRVTGAGQGFSNIRPAAAGNVSIILEGYNYDMLCRIAEQLWMLSLKNPRIANQWIGGSMSIFGESSQSEILAMLDAQQLALFEISASDLLRALPNQQQQFVMQAWHEGQLLPVRLRPGNPVSNHFWDAKNNATIVNGNYLKPNAFMAFERRQSGAYIHKYNQQYRLYFHFDFNGPYRLMEHVSNRLLEETRLLLPIGYEARKAHFDWMVEHNNDYWLILLVIVIIFVMCAILLESVMQPLAVVCMIPVSFIGLFLTFFVFDLNFDQGGLAAFLLLSGLSVNAALYLLNDFNLFRKKFPGESPTRNYIKALHYKIMPISLTVISTIVGLVPFVIGRKEVFWSAFAAGTMGGLLFAFCAVIFLLPVFLNINKQ